MDAKDAGNFQNWDFKIKRYWPIQPNLFPSYVGVGFQTNMMRWVPVFYMERLSNIYNPLIG